MRRLVVLAASLPLLAFAASDASAQALSGSAFPGGGVRAGGGVGAGAPAAPMNRALASPSLGGSYRPGLAAGGLGGYRTNAYRGSSWGYGAGHGYRGAYYGRPGYWRRGYRDNWGWGAGALAAGTVLGAAAAYPYYYGAPYYDEPSYYYSRPYYAEPYYAAPASSGIGEYCQTPVRTCRLINPSEVGVGCSCRVAGGRAHGSVVP